MSRLQSFRGTFGGNSGSNVFNSGQSQVLDNFAQTPTPKPMKSTRSGKTFSGAVTSRLPRASNIDPGFGAMNLPAGGREGFGRLGARAGDQSVDSWNSAAAAFNETAASDKATEIRGYEQSVAGINSQYGRDVDAFNTEVNNYQSQADNAIWFHNRYRSGFDNLDALKRTADLKYQSEGYRRGYKTSIADAEQWQGFVDDKIGHLRKASQGSGLHGWPNKSAGVPDYLFTGTFDGTIPTRDFGSPPARPSLPNAPNPIFEQRQMQDALPERLDRRLAPDQREIVGGDLPPQVATESGDTFGESAINYGSIDLREISQINQSEQQTLGAPKAYRVPSWYWTQNGQSGGGGGQTISPSDITNQNSTSFFIRGYGWILKSQLTPLY